MYILTVHTDGASKKGKVAGSGACATFNAGEESSSTTVEAQWTRHLPSATNNEAEYDGLLLALEKLPRFISQLEIPEQMKRTMLRVLICMDSKLVVQQVNGFWTCKAVHLQPLLLRARERLAALQKDVQRVDIVWISRKENKVADKLANDACLQPSPASK